MRAFFYILMVSGYIYIVNSEDSYTPVFNDGLSKMEMIEKMDKFLGSELPKQIAEVKNRLENHELESKNNFQDLKTSINDIENRLKKLEEGLEKSSSENNDIIAPDLISYLKELRSIVIPAIQKKILDNENRLSSFIQQMTAVMNTKETIKSELSDDKNEGGADE